MIFKELGILSRFVKSYYLQPPTQMFLDIQPTLNLQQKDYLPGWNDSLVVIILQRFTSQIVWDSSINHAIYTKCYYARHIKNDEFLTELAYLFEEGTNLTATLDASKLFPNFAYGSKRESLFYAPHCKGSLF